MSEIKLGNKYDCFNCGVKFYDLGKGAGLCPKCGADQKDASDKNSPLMSQSVRRRRRAELTTDDGDSPAEPDAEVATLAEEADLADEDLDLADEADEDEDVEEA